MPTPAGDERSRHDVVLRERRHGWELTGLPWPGLLSPGVVVSLEWTASRPAITACVRPLTRPESLDGREYLHTYDMRVAVREARVGTNMTDRQWVLVTLRRLGYLCEDGSVMLAEPALVRNCVELGLSEDRGEELGRTVRALVDDGTVRRVRGSVDVTGQPHHPARRGDRPVDLLRWAPAVRPLTDAELALVARRVVASRDHQVAPHLRRLPAGAQPSLEQVERHQEAVAGAGVVGRALPVGHTFVRGHDRRGRRGR